MNPVFTPALVKNAVRAAADAYDETPTHVAGEAEGRLKKYGDTWHFSIRGTEFDGSGIIFGDMLIDVLVYPVWHPVLGWVHKGFAYGRLIPDANQGGAVGLFKAAYADLIGLGEPYVIDGHSKAGPQTSKVAALMTDIGHPPKAFITVDGVKGFIGGKINKVLKDVPGLHVRVPASPVNRLPLGPWWHHGPGDVLELGPPFSFPGNIKAHQSRRIQKLADAHFS